MSTKPQKTLIVPRSQIGRVNDSALLLKEDQGVYQSMLGSLMYATQGTRPDLAYTVTKLGQFLHAPTEEHLDAMNYAFRYVAGTANYALHYDGSLPLNFEGYSDAD